MVTEAKKIIKKVSFVYLQKLTTAVALMAFLVAVAAGIQGGAGLMMILWRALCVMVVIGVISRIIIRILESYEEMNSGKG